MPVCFIRMIWFTLVSVAVATSPWCLWPRCMRPANTPVANELAIDQTDPLEPVHNRNGKENFFTVLTLPEGFAIRVLPTGVSLFSLYGLPPIRFDQFGVVFRILNDYSLPSISSSIPPVVMAPDLKRHAGFWVANCYSDVWGFIGSQIMISFSDDINKRAEVHCDRLRARWNAVAQLSESSSVWTGFYAKYESSTTFEFATIDANTSPDIIERMSNHILMKSIVFIFIFRMIWFTLLSVAVAYWPSWPRWHRRVAPELAYVNELDQPLDKLVIIDQTSPLEATFNMDGKEYFFILPIEQLPSGLAIRLLPQGVSLLTLYGLPPIRFDKFGAILRILNNLSIPSVPCSIPPVVYAPDVKRHSGLWVVNCFMDEVGLIGSHVMISYPPNIEERAVFRCDKLRGTWNAIVQLSDSTEGWTGFYATYKSPTTYEFATIDQNTFPDIIKRMTTIIY